MENKDGTFMQKAKLMSDWLMLEASALHNNLI